MRRPAILIAILLLVGLSACGSSSKKTSTTPTGSDATQIRAMIDDYLAAVYGGDGPGACAKMTSGLQTEFVARVATLSASQKGKPCSEVLGSVLTAAGKQVQDTKPIADTLKLTNLKITGDKATMTGQFTIKGKVFSSPYSAERVGGQWLLSCCVPS